MTSDKVLNQLTALYRGFSGSYTAAEKLRIEALNYEVTGRVMRSCRCQDRYHDAVIEMLHTLKKNVRMNPKSNYKLVPGVVIQPAGTSEVYTNANLTDKVASDFLKERPNAVALFEVIPSSESGDAGQDENSTSDIPSSELIAAQARITELEAENELLKASKIEPKDDEGNPSNDDTLNPNEDEKDEGGQGVQPIEINTTIEAMVAQKLAEKKSKAAIKASLSGKTIEGIKLTHKIIAAHIKAVEGNTEA